MARARPAALGGGRRRRSRASGSVPTARSPSPGTRGRALVMEAFARLPDAAARGDHLRRARRGARRAIRPSRGDIDRGAALRRGRRGRAPPARWERCGRISAAVRAGAVPLPPGAPGRGRRAAARSSTPTGTRWEGDVAVVATGAAYDHLPGSDGLWPTACAGSGCRCSRRRRSPPRSRRRSPTPTPCATTRPTRRHRWPRSARRAPVAAAHHLQLLLVQRPDGGLTIGDTHAYGEPFDFALSEDPTDELLARARRILGAALPPVRRRWEGVYAQCVDGAVCLREEIEHRASWLVTGPGGRGMTCAPAIAADTLRAAGARVARRDRPFALACLDMAGTTVRDDGAVEAAFARRPRPPWGSLPGSPRSDGGPRRACTRRWAGPRPTCSPRCSSRTRRREATAAFAAAYEAIVAAGERDADPRCAPVLRDLRARGRHGLPHHRFRALDPRRAARRPGLGAPRSTWPSRPADVGRGRPAPDMVLGAMARLGVADPRGVVVVGRHA